MNVIDRFVRLRRCAFKDTLWVLRRDEPLVHVSVDISLITKYIFDHDISLESREIYCIQLSKSILPDMILIYLVIYIVMGLYFYNLSINSR